MSGATVAVGAGLVVVLVLLVGVAVGAAVIARFAISRALVTAALRAVVQLALVAAVIVAVVRSWPLTVVFVLLMLGTASWTSARRMTRDRTGLLAAGAIAAGVVPVLLVALASGTVPLRGIAVVPVAGIVIGGAMTATSLGGRRALDELEARRDEYEGALALDGRRRDAAMLVCRPSATQALLPPLDQTDVLITTARDRRSATGRPGEQQSTLSATSPSRTGRGSTREIQSPSSGALPQVNQ